MIKILVLISCFVGSLRAEQVRPLWADDNQIMYYELISASGSIATIQFLVDNIRNHPHNLELYLIMIEAELENIRKVAYGD